MNKLHSKLPISVFNRSVKTAALFLVCLYFGSCEKVCLAQQSKPLKVFVLAGQSNMQGHAQVKTFAAARMNAQAAPLLEDLTDENGEPKTCRNVWISSVGSADVEQTGQLTIGYGAKAGGPKIGPEYTFGFYMERYLDEPILIIKTAWGGKSINTDFRPPSAEPYQFSSDQLELFRKQGKDVSKLQAEKKAATGVYYAQMIKHINHVLGDIERVYPGYDPESGYELAGFVWFQGWNDMVDRGTYPNRDQPDGYAEYSELLAELIRNIRKDLQAPSLPVVIGVLGVGGPTQEYGQDQQRYKSTHDNFRQAMAEPAKMEEFEGTVAAVLTERYWDQEIVRLRRIEKTIQPQIKEIKKQIANKDRTKKDGDAAIEQLYRDTFSESELSYLRDSVSNGDYHYMGSAAIMTQIGKGFAEAMMGLLNRK
ncbi:sialate O-acetylesterase [Stieleria sp. JC731]|uniref:sialate O-acetylesterase n=1 Tax=Pirellulaceae TaxID=2691357 RepID=UPI001E3FE672|nr:sialate O-acetylesterase [Stieleria sp. JC731]MCC9601291.1 sialate O-acetylesterase [Stieleria sp. JC731]